MCYKRIKGSILLARNSVSKIGDCQAISFYSYMLAPNDREQFKAVFSNLLVSAEFNTEIESPTNM